MDDLAQRMSEELLRYRELLALSYDLKRAIEEGQIEKFLALIDHKQALIDGIRDTEEELGPARGHLVGEIGSELKKHLMSEAAAVLEKTISLDKETERLVEMKMGGIADELKQLREARDRKAAYQRTLAGSYQSRFIDSAK